MFTPWEQPKLLIWKCRPLIKEIFPKEQDTIREFLMFRSLIQEQILNDRTFKYFFIANNYDKILDEKQKAFLKLVISNDDSEAQVDSFTEKILKLVEEAKINSQWRKQFMEWEREMAIRFREGERQARIEDARNLFANGVSIEIIAKSLNMTVEEVTEITKSVVPVNA